MCVCVFVSVRRELCYQRSADPAKASAPLPGWAQSSLTGTHPYVPVGEFEMTVIVLELKI